MTDNTKQTDALVIERVLDAPVDMIWKLWTEPEHFKQWYGPNGMQVPVAEMDLRVGGVRRVCMEMQTPDGTMQMWTLGAFTEIVINERLVYTEQYTDPEGNPVQPHGGEGMPPQTIVTIVLSAVNGGTRMVMTHAGLPETEGANGGWNQAFDKLTAYISTIDID